MENQRWQGFHNNWDFYFGNGLWKVKTEILVFMKTCCHLWFSIMLDSFWLCLFIIKLYSRHYLFSIVFFLVFKILECFLYLSIVVDIGSFVSIRNIRTNKFLCLLYITFESSVLYLRNIFGYLYRIIISFANCLVLKFEMYAFFFPCKITKIGN